jgi:hypothetical protein
MMILQYFLLLLSEGGGIAPGPGAEMLWQNNLGDEIRWQNDSLQPIEWTQN